MEIPEVKLFTIRQQKTKQKINIYKRQIILKKFIIIFNNNRNSDYRNIFSQN